MLDIFNLEKQAARRIRSFIEHLSTQENITPDSTRLVIKKSPVDPTVFLFNGNQFVKPLSIQQIVAYFGKEWDGEKQQAVNQYLEQLSTKLEIPVSEMNLVVCDHKGEIGAFVYHENRYIRKLPILDVFSHFYSRN